MGEKSKPIRQEPLHKGTCSGSIWVFHGKLGERSLGARLRTRKVTGRDASLPAPLLSAFAMLVARGTIGALPQTPQGTLSLDPARGRRKGTKSPLDPFPRLSWSRFHAPSACSFLALRLSPCLPPTFREEPLFMLMIDYSPHSPPLPSQTCSMPCRSSVATWSSASE